MATPYSEVFELFLATVQDYTLQALYSSSVANFEIELVPFLNKSIAKFFEANQDLTNKNDTTRTFNITLTLTEMAILANLMSIEWLTHQINNLLELQNLVGDKDFNRKSEASILNSKIKLRDTLKEDVENQMIRYNYQNNDWEGTNYL
jgi:phage host-nuclease inhibitor protein Gam